MFSLDGPFFVLLGLRHYAKGPPISETWPTDSVCRVSRVLEQVKQKHAHWGPVYCAVWSVLGHAICARGPVAHAINPILPMITMSVRQSLMPND